MKDTGKTLSLTRNQQDIGTTAAPSEGTASIFVLQKDFYCIVLSHYNQKVQVAMLTKFTGMSFESAHTQD